MKKIALWSILSFILFKSYSCKHEANETDAQDYTEANHPVRELYLNSIKGFNEGKLEVFLANFAPDIKMYGTDGNYFGKTALRQRFETLFAQFPKMQMEIPELNLDVLSKTIVLVHFKWKVYPMGKGPAFYGIGSGLYTYMDGQWLEILEVETITDMDAALKQKSLD